jgi:hypothetical protein
MNGHKILFTLIAAAFAAVAHADESASLPAKTTAYYYGQGRILNLKSGSNSTEETLLVRVVDPASNHLVEVACTLDPGRVASISATYMLISGNTLTLSDKSDYSQTGKLVGIGQLSGTPWLWNYLKFSMKYYFSSAPGSYVQIEDVNYLVGNQLVARKQLYLPDESPFELWDAELTLTSPDDFHAHAIAMNCPPFPDL